MLQARIRNVKRVRGERRRAADIDLESGRRGVLRDEVTDGVNGLIRLNLADIACKTQKYVRGLAVDALRSGAGDRLPPQIHDVLHVLCVLLQPLHQIVVVLVVSVVQRSVGFQHDHGQARGRGLVELLTDLQHRSLRRRVGRDHRPREFCCDVLDLRHKGVGRYGKKRPKHDDRYSEDAYRSRDERTVRPMLAHADFTLQVTSAS